MTTKLVVDLKTGTKISRELTAEEQVQRDTDTANRKAERTARDAKEARQVAKEKARDAVLEDLFDDVKYRNLPDVADYRSKR